MALVLKDRVKETSTTAGTGTITLAGAQPSKIIVVPKRLVNVVL